MTDAKRIAKLEAQVEALRARLEARTTQLTLVLLQIVDLKAELALVKSLEDWTEEFAATQPAGVDSRAWLHEDARRA